MTDPIPINLAAIEARQAQSQAKDITARQVLSEERFQESVDTGFNPGAVERQQARINRFRTLESRGKTGEGKEKKIEEVMKAEGQEDLAQEFNHRNPELDAEKLNRLRAGLKDTTTPEEILEMVEEIYSDATLADEAMEFLERSTTGDLNNAVRGARGLLNELRGREVIAGRNIAPAVETYHKKGLGETPTILRDLYRDITGNPRDHNTLFSELAAKYPFDELKLVVAFLLKGLGYDLKSKGPSIQQAELMRLMTDMRNLQSILWVYLFFRSRMKMIRQLFAKYKIPLSKTLTFEQLAKEFIKLVEERYPSVMKLLKQTEKMGLEEDDSKIIILTQFRDAIRGLSPRLYKSLRQRQDLLLVILETLEELEEETEEKDEG
jgi:type III secretion protein W